MNEMSKRHAIEMRRAAGRSQADVVERLVSGRDTENRVPTDAATT